MAAKTEKEIEKEMKSKGYRYKLTFKNRPATMPKGIPGKPAPLFVKTLNQIAEVMRVYPDVEFSIKEV